VYSSAALVAHGAVYGLLRNCSTASQCVAALTSTARLKPIPASNRRSALMRSRRVEPRKGWTGLFGKRCFRPDTLTG
jgi:hypothetical protein